MPPKGPKHSKKRCFLTPQARRHRKLQVLQSGGSGSAAGAAAHIRPGARRARSWPCPCRTAVLSSPKEPTTPPTPYHQNILRFTVFFCCSHFLPFFGSSGSRCVNMGQHRPQDRPDIALKWGNIALRWAQIALKIGQHSPKMGQHRPT